MEGAQDEVGAAGPDLVVAIRPGVVNEPVGSLRPKIRPVDRSGENPV